MNPRWPWAALCLTACVTLGLALWLEPSASGVGTHTQLGLPPCGLYAWTGLPCPGCGLTTSFAHLARLELLPALDANPVGLPLFLGTAASIPLTAVGFVRRWSLLSVIDALQIERPLLWLMGAAGASWAARLFSMWAS